ncbi:hypothetical protein [Streptomyces sp. NPDC003435]
MNDVPFQGGPRKGRLAAGAALAVLVLTGGAATTAGEFRFR